MREPGQYWKEELNNYFSVTGLSAPRKEVTPVRNLAYTLESGAFSDKIFFMSQEMVENYFRDYDEEACIGIAFPFRTIGKLSNSHDFVTR
jgi:hypothetical protein